VAITVLSCPKHSIIFYITSVFCQIKFNLFKRYLFLKSRKSIKGVFLIWRWRIDKNADFSNCRLKTNNAKSEVRFKQLMNHFTTCLKKNYILKTRKKLDLKQLIRVAIRWCVHNQCQLQHQIFKNHPSGTYYQCISCFFSTSTYVVFVFTYVNCYCFFNLSIYNIK
jgi:hypothetical protein